PPGPHLRGRSRERAVVRRGGRRRVPRGVPALPSAARPASPGVPRVALRSLRRGVLAGHAGAPPLRGGAGDPAVQGGEPAPGALTGASARVRYAPRHASGGGALGRWGMSDESSESRTESASRIDALRRTSLLDSPPEEAFDRLTRLAATVLRVPAALVSL